jgi:hypothetical protein
MNIDEFIDKAKGDLELFRQEYRKMVPDGNAPPIYPAALEAMRAEGVDNPDESFTEEDRFWSEFSGWRTVDPDDPDGPDTKPPTF